MDARRRPATGFRRIAPRARVSGCPFAPGAGERPSNELSISAAPSLSAFSRLAEIRPIPSVHASL
jgi:hypothetical protein